MTILRTINPREEAKVRAIRRMCHELHIMPPPVAYVGFQVYQCPPHLLINGRIPEGLKLDELGIAPSLVYDARSQSWVRNAYNLLLTQLGALPLSYSASYGAGGTYCKTTGGSNLDQSSTIYVTDEARFIGVSGDDTQGIIVGTTPTAESFEHYALAAKVTSGTGAGQLEYGAQVATVGTYTSGTKTWASVLVRYFNNNSNGSIDIDEVGWYVLATESAGNIDLMLARDLIDPTVSVADTAQLKVTYTVTSPAFPA